MSVDSISLDVIADILTKRARYSDAMVMRKAIVLISSFLHEELISKGASQMELCLSSICHANAVEKFNEAHETMMFHMNCLDNTVAVERPSTP